jgi:hypothetical protein
MGVGDYFNPSISREYGPAAEYGMTSEELEEELRRIDRQRLAGVMDSRPDTGPLFTPRPMIERQFARPVEQPTRAATREVRKALPPVSLLQDSIVDPTDLLPQQSTTLIGRQSVDRSPADIKSIGREVKAKKQKQRATNPADLRMPVTAPRAPAALLDTAEPSAEPGTSWYDDPMRMGLIQAGLGLLSAPQYSTNMNDVAFFPTAARGISGFLQGYGGTKERLAEEERQKLEDEFKRSQIEFDRLYKTALTNEAIGRTEQMQRLLEQPAKDQQEWERRVREIYPGENNATAKKLIAAGPDKGPALLKDLLPGVRRTETERTQLINSVNNNKILGADKKKELIEMINETDKNGFTSSYSQIQTAIKNAEEKIQPKPPNAPKLSDNFRILLQEDMNESNPQAQIAFGEEYLKSYDRRTSYDEAGSKIEVPVYQNIPAAIREKYPNLARQQDELVASQQASVTRPNQTVIQANAVYEELSAIENRIQETGADTPLPVRYELENKIVKMVPFVGDFMQSDEYRQKMTLQNEWIESVLRDVSGAAIGVSEYDNYRAIYFPIAGDSEQMIQARRLARMRALKERERVALGLQGFRDPQKAANDHISGVSTQTTGVTNPTVAPALTEGVQIPDSAKQYLGQ